MVRRPCSHESCLACQADRQDFCYTDDFAERGIKEKHGFMTEFVVDDEKYMFKVPQLLRDVGVLIEPLTIAEKALYQIWDVQERLPWTSHSVKEMGKGRRAVVLGAGPVGLLGAMTLLNAGFETYVYSRGALSSTKAVLTESMGATYVSSQKDSLHDLSRRVGNIDVVYEAVGASQLAFEIMKVLGTNGILAFTGVPGRKAPIQVDTDRIMRNLVLKNQAVFGTVNAGREAHESAVKNLETFKEQWPQAVQSMITGRFPIEAFHDLLLKPSSGIKNVISFDRV
jgi:threonine dehydrogenase-like Zn-dependent dehydrogenase